MTVVTVAPDAPGVGDRRPTDTVRTAAASAVIRTEVLDCGIRLVTEAMADVRSVTVGVWVGTGSRDEDERRAGASHFLEHLLFKGTPSWSAADIAEAVDEVGGDMNAFTTKEYTVFYIRLLSEDLPLGLDVLGAIMTDPALRPDDIEAERQVILDEILMHADEPSDLSAEQCVGALFPGHPLGREVLGAPASVSALDAPEIRHFFDTHYRTGNLVLSAAGDLDHDHLAAEVDRRFRGRSGGSAPQRRPPDSPPHSLVVTRRPTEQVHLVVGLRAPGRHSEDRWPLAVLNHVLGGGVASRLFQEIRERRGLAYSIWSDRTHYDEIGSLAVNVGTAPEHAREVLGLVHGELDRLGEKGITERELSVARGHLRAETLLSLEDSGARMSRIGSSLLLHGHVLDVDDLLARVDAVTVAEVATLAGKLADEPRTLSVVGPFDRDDFAP
ncbi:MAG TPA: pitrilysin family protein [Acidimicrobiales bacterium]|nr:pitrilysin family protein [Acidimicrobiales bacterium]